MRPTVCPRCARASDTWTYEREEGIAGCPCGEVIPYVIDDVPLQPLSTTPKQPRLWSEDARTDGFTATLKPSLRWLWYALPIALPIVGVRLAPVGSIGGLTGFLLAFGAVLAVIAWAVSDNARPWSFAIEGGRFRAQARGHRTDIALEEIQRFDAISRPESRKRKASDTRARFQLAISHTNGERTRVPLFVESPREARFVADRANTMLASEGRTIAGNYRGQHVRIADIGIAPPAVDEVAREELDSDEHAERRQVRE